MTPYVFCAMSRRLGLLRRGLIDLTVSEVLYSLADAGEFAVDVGANVADRTSVLSRRVGGDGTVLTFEPHPVIRIPGGQRAEVGCSCGCP